MTELESAHLLSVMRSEAADLEVQFKSADGMTFPPTFKLDPDSHLVSVTTVPLACRLFLLPVQANTSSLKKDLQYSNIFYRLVTIL